MPTKKCPFCAEAILTDAIKCKHCGSSVAPGICIKCGEQNSHDAPLCSYCGAENLITANSAINIPESTETAEMLLTLRLINERRRVSLDLLRAHYGSSSRASNILSILELRGFIRRPKGSNRWEIAFDKIEGILNQVGDEKSNTNEVLSSNIINTTSNSPKELLVDHRIKKSATMELPEGLLNILEVAWTLLCGIYGLSKIFISPFSDEFGFLKIIGVFILWVIVLKYLSKIGRRPL